MDYELIHVDSEGYIVNVCGDCIYFTGEECNGKFEGNEKYTHSTACDEFDAGENT